MLRQQGMTLVELMITLAIFAILIGIAAPNFGPVLKKNRVETQLRELGTQMKFARSEAVSVQRTVTICHLDSGAPPKCDANWGQGVTIFYDDDTDGELENATDIIRVINEISPNVLSVIDAGGTDQNSMQFDSRGRSSIRGTVKICDSGGQAKYARALLLELTGMALLSKLNTGTNLYKDINDADLGC